MRKEDIEAFIPLLFELKEKLPKKGRLYYKLLPEELKKQVDALVEKLKKQNNYINIRVDEYAESKHDLRCCTIPTPITFRHTAKMP